METTASGVALVVVSVIAMFVVLAAFAWVRGAARSPGAFLVFAMLAAVAATFSSLFYVVYFAATAAPLTLAVGDTAMVLAPALLWVAIGSMNGRRRWRLWVVLLAGVGMFVVSLTTNEVVSSATKIALLLIGCLLGALEARIGAARTRRGMPVVTVTLVAYAVFCIGRIVSLTAGGLDGEVYSAYFSTGPTTVGGVVTIILLAFGVLRAAQDDRVTRDVQRRSVRENLVAHAAQMLAEHGAVAWRAVSVAEVSLMRESFGQDYVDEAELALLTACRDSAPDAIVGVIAPARIVIVDVPWSRDLVVEEVRTRFARASDLLRELYVPEVEIDAVVVTTTAELDAVAHA
ncbi:hypothetical protein AB0N73_05805 [Microbacterium sp. NPDC089189]|uniref:hypothetical protein n=1 Tax=Microbacterium sp. NPDC089189 TaxID=3154972 RepID=UPI003444FC4F